ncbi:MAG: hypothetical protein ACOYVK_18575 [Bacillota bacterium]
MELKRYNDDEMNHKIMEACFENNRVLKENLIEMSEEDPRIPAMVFNNLYELVDFDLNFVIDVLAHSSERERNTILRAALDNKTLENLFDEYSRPVLETIELEDIVEGRDIDIIWDIKSGSKDGDMSKAYLERCLLTIAYYLGYEAEVKAFFDKEKRQYLTLH